MVDPFRLNAAIRVEPSAVVAYLVAPLAGTDGSQYVSMDARLQIGIAHCSRGVMRHSFNVPTRHCMGLQRFMPCSPNFVGDRGMRTMKTTWHNGPAHGRVGIRAAKEGTMSRNPESTGDG